MTTDSAPSGTETVTSAQKQQAELPFTRQDRFRFLRSASQRFPPRKRKRIKTALETITICSDKDGCKARVERLAAIADVSPATMRRYIKEAEEIGWLAVERDRFTCGGQVSNGYYIQWTTIRSAAVERQKSLFDQPAVELEDTSDYVKTGEQSSGSQTDEAALQTDTARDQSAKAADQTDSAFSKEVVPSSVPSTLPPPLPPDAAGAFDAGRWVVVVQKLMELDVVDSRNVVKSAHENGATPEYVEQIIDHYKTHPGAWGPGALRNRVRDAKPGINPGALWPPASSAFEKKERKKKQDAERKQKQAEAVQQKQKRAATDEQQAAERAEYGEKLARLSDEEILELADSQGDVVARMVRKVPASVRRKKYLVTLMSALKQREQNAKLREEGRQERESEQQYVPRTPARNPADGREQRLLAVLDGLTDDELEAVVDRMEPFDRDWTRKNRRENWKKHCWRTFIRYLEDD